MVGQEMPYTVDSHTHIISSDQERYPANPLGGHRSQWSKKRKVGIEELLHQADAAKVDRVVVVQASTVYGFDNRYLADALAKHRGRISAVCAVDFLGEASAVKQLAGHIQEDGFAGTRIRAADGATKVPTPGRGLDDEQMNPVWRYLEEHRVPVSIQMHAQHAPALVRVLEGFPHLTVVLDHSGRPPLSGSSSQDALGELRQLTRYPRVFLKVTTPAMERAQRIENASPELLIEKLVEEFGASRLMWGSNYPSSPGSLTELRERIEEKLQHVGDPEREWILGKTASDVYQL